MIHLDFLHVREAFENACVTTKVCTTFLQDVAASIFLAYSAKQFEGNRWYFAEVSMLPDSMVTQESRQSQYLSETMGTFSLGVAGCVCLGLAAYRMMWGDDRAKNHDSSFPPGAPKKKLPLVFA